MSSLSYHKKPNGTTYVYRLESYWDKSKKQPRNKQVCIGKLGSDNEIIYNKRFATPEAREALEQGAVVAESVLIGQSLILRKATEKTGLERVVRQCFSPDTADVLLSLAWAMATGVGQMYLASVWMEQNECAAHTVSPTSQDISRMLAKISQSDADAFLAVWAKHRSKAAREQYCYDITSISSHSANNPFVEWGHNRDREDLQQINMALLTGVTSHIPTYYELHPGSLSDTKTLKGFIERMNKYGLGRVRTLLDRGFYSASNIKAMLQGKVGFYIPVPANIKWAQDLIDKYRDAVEMPDYILPVEEGERRALYGMTVLGKMEGKRVWKHIYYDGARRSQHIESLFASLQAWECELKSGELKKGNQWAYDEYFIQKTTPKRGRQVKRNQEAINAYKTDRAGYWVIVTNCEKDAARALEAYRERSLVESQFDDMKNDLTMSRFRTHNPDTMRGRALVQFLALVVTAQVRLMLAKAWEGRLDVPKEDRLARRYSLGELMMRLGTYRQTSFSGRYGKVISAPTKAQRTIFLAFGINVNI